MNYELRAAPISHPSQRLKNLHFQKSPFILESVIDWWKNNKRVQNSNIAKHLNSKIFWACLYVSKPLCSTLNYQGRPCGAYDDPLQGRKKRHIEALDLYCHAVHDRFLMQVNKRYHIVLHNLITSFFVVSYTDYFKIEG